LTEEEVHRAETEELSAGLLQVKLKDTSVATDGGEAEAEASIASMDRSIASMDHNGNACLLCGKPLPERLGGKIYTEFRTDCGKESTPTGPSADALTKPAVLLQKGGSGNGFCELNFAKSCADAIANRDYLYWAKSQDMAAPAMRKSAQWEASYCHSNGFLGADIVALQHNFTGMQARAKQLCATKYVQHDQEKLSFVDMMASANKRDRGLLLSRKEAERLAAWNCAMGDLGCDMAMCAYSFCARNGGEGFGLYHECQGWTPVAGMPFGPHS